MWVNYFLLLCSPKTWKERRDCCMSQWPLIFPPVSLQFRYFLDGSFSSSYFSFLLSFEQEEQFVLVCLGIAFHSTPWVPGWKGRLVSLAVSLSTSDLAVKSSSGFDSCRCSRLHSQSQTCCSLIYSLIHSADTYAVSQTQLPLPVQIHLCDSSCSHLSLMLSDADSVC